jgi:hypothetical protein
MRAMLRDTLSRSGAEYLAQRIASYWFSQGYVVETMVVPSSVFHDMVWVVRSNMINGLPRRRQDG